MPRHRPCGRQSSCSGSPTAERNGASAPHRGRRRRRDVAGDECFGTPIVTAERLRAAAGSGQIVVTGPVRVLGRRPGRRRLRATRVGVPRGRRRGRRIVGRSAGTGRRPTPRRAARRRSPLALAGSAGPPFVGRSDVLNALSTEWTDAGVDTGRIVLIGGEAGTRARPDWRPSWRVASTPAGRRSCTERCDDDLALPYQPWVQALDPGRAGPRRG